jgi:hypothetical protein
MMMMIIIIIIIIMNLHSLVGRYLYYPINPTVNAYSGLVGSELVYTDTVLQGQPHVLAEAVCMTP